MNHVSLKHSNNTYSGVQVLKGIAVIEADREVVRAEQAAELAKFKALAETLAGALELYAQWGGPTAREALRKYKEATNV